MPIELGELECDVAGGPSCGMASSSPRNDRAALQALLLEVRKRANRARAFLGLPPLSADLGPLQPVVTKSELREVLGVPDVDVAELAIEVETLPEGDERDRALDLLAETIAEGWRVMHREVRDALRPWVARFGGWKPAKVAAVREGVLLVLHAASSRRSVRFGPHYIKNAAGQRLELSLNDLVLGEAREHIRGQAIRAAESILMDRPYRPPVLRPKVDALDQETSDLESEERALDGAQLCESFERPCREDEILDVLSGGDTDSAEWRKLLDASTPRQREILEVLHAWLDRGLGLPEAKARTAADLDVTVGNLDVVFSRLRALL